MLLPYVLSLLQFILQYGCLLQEGSCRSSDFWSNHLESCKEQDLRANRHQDVDSFTLFGLSPLAVC